MSIYCVSTGWFVGCTPWRRGHVVCWQIDIAEVVLPGLPDSTGGSSCAHQSAAIRSLHTSLPVGSAQQTQLCSCSYCTSASYSGGGIQWLVKYIHMLRGLDEASHQSILSDNSFLSISWLTQDRGFLLSSVNTHTLYLSVYALLKHDLTERDTLDTDWPTDN